jgi:uncharacterized protein YodC (DUF2158 family)
VKLSVGDLVRLKAGGPVMAVEAERGDDNFTFTWFENDRPRSMVLPSSLVTLVEAKPQSAMEMDAAYKLPQAIVDLEERVAALEEKLDARGYNTRPMYEVHDEKIKQIEERIGRLERSSEESEDTTKKLGQ